MITLDKYRVKISEDKDLHPEETLADSLSQHSIIEIPIGLGVFRALYIFMLIFAVFIFVKSFQLQIVNGKHLSLVARRTVYFKYSVPALRGIIYDTNGRALVGNIPVFDLIAVHNDLPASGPEIDRIVKSISAIVNIDRTELLNIFTENKNSAVFLIKRGISKEEVAKITALTLNGIHIAANSRRHYTDGEVFSSVLGYTAKVSRSDIENDPYYLPTDRIGRLGIEAYYEEELRGERRGLILDGDVQAGKENALPGHDLILSIDARVQQKLYQTMTNVLRAAGLKRGAAIVQNPKTGEIKGLISLPSFDGNVFENYFEKADAQKIAKILQDKDKALFNRVVAGRYSPGSTIKPLLALAGLKEGMITPATTIYANGSISVPSRYDPNVVYTFRDWRIHGLTNLKKAIADSVDVYFYALGGGYGNIRGLGIDRIVDYLRSFMTDKILGVDLPGEAGGVIPSPEWKQKVKGEQWFVGDTYNISIGQGDLNVTPLWLNTYLNSLANGGDLMRPYLVSAIKNPDGIIISKTLPQSLGKIPFDEQTIKIVKEGMRETVLSGTAVALRNLPVEVAAKTGTAQVSGRGLNSLFIVFGPYENPEISMTILVEGVEGQSLAIDIARDFLLWYFTNSYPQPQ